MGFQTVFNIQQAMTVNNRRMVGQTYSRSGQLFVSQYLTAVPWVFTITPYSYMPWTQSRTIVQQIANLDRETPDYVIFNDQGYCDLSWYTKYLGSFAAPLTGIVVASTPAANATTVTLTNLPTQTAGLVLFNPGDFIEFSGHVYNVTQQVLTGGATVNVPLHRPVIGPVTPGDPVAVGNDVEFYLIAEQCPTYNLNPAPNGGFIEWSGPFVFREYLV